MVMGVINLASGHTFKYLFGHVQKKLIFYITWYDNFIFKMTIKAIKSTLISRLNQWFDPQKIIVISI